MPKEKMITISQAVKKWIGILMTEILILGFIAGAFFGAALYKLFGPIEKVTVLNEPRTENFQRNETCEIWKVCDYKEDFPCIGVKCKESYKCWEEKRNCINPNAKAYNWSIIMPPCMPCYNYTYDKTFIINASYFHFIYENDTWVPKIYERKVE
jgi:hypothetical protein